MTSALIYDGQYKFICTYPEVIQVNQGQKIFTRSCDGPESACGIEDVTQKEVFFPLPRDMAARGHSRHRGHIEFILEKIRRHDLQNVMSRRQEVPGTVVVIMMRLEAEFVEVGAVPRAHGILDGVV
jgi:hypothetical protein